MAKRKGAKKAAGKAAAKGRRPAKKGGAKKAAKKGGMKRAAKKGAKKGAKRPAKKGGAKKAAKKKGGGRKGARKSAAKKAPSAAPAGGGSSGGKEAGSDAPSGLRRPTADSQPAAVGEMLRGRQGESSPSGPTATATRGSATARVSGPVQAAKVAKAEERSKARPPSVARVPPGPATDRGGASPEGPVTAPVPPAPIAVVRRTRGPAPKESVLDANKAFYQALEERDIGAITRLWVNDETVRCTQPNGVMKRGWEEVRRAFEGLFSADRPHKIELTQVYAEESDGLAYVSLVEQVAMPQSSRPRREHVATNQYRNVEGRWRLVNHHVT